MTKETVGTISNSKKEKLMVEDGLTHLLEQKDFLLLFA